MAHFYIFYVCPSVKIQITSFFNGVAFDAKQDNIMLSMHVLYTLTPPAVIQQQEEIIRSWKTLKISKIQISK